MSILIKGVDMPTEYPLWIVVSADGTVQYNYFNEWKTAEEKAVPVPPHGRLIDADALEKHIKDDWEEYDHWIAVEVENRPTIIPAEEGDT